MSYLQLLAAVGDLALIVLLPVMITVARILYGIKTNDLPHIREAIVDLGGEVKD